MTARTIFSISKKASELGELGLDYNNPCRPQPPKA